MAKKIKKISVKRYKRIEGDLFIYGTGRIFLGKEQLFCDDMVSIPISTLKEIITDAKAGII